MRSYPKLRSVIIPCFMGVILALGGCAGKFGPNTVEPARFNYNQAIHRSVHEQMLINIVRHRYNEAPYFLGIGTVVSQYSLGASVGTSGSVSNAAQYTVGGTGGVNYTESPTITYRPMEDAEFAERLLLPVSPSILVMLSHSGWQLEDLMQLCVQRINGLSNIPVANVQHPDALARYRLFEQVTQLFRELQSYGAVGQRVQTDENKKEPLYVLYFEQSDDPAIQERIQKAKSLLGLDPKLDVFPVKSTFSGGQASNSIALETRSMQGIIGFLSRGVQIPPADHDRVVHSATVEELQADFDAIYGDVFVVRHASQRPRDAFVAVRHRDTWFYIDDRDTRSKTTFTILLYLFSVQAIGAEKGGDILLTLPTS